jgi:hypothetical protein
MAGWRWNSAPDLRLKLRNGGELTGGGVQLAIEDATLAGCVNTSVAQELETPT